MTPEEAAAASADAVSKLASYFMLDPPTYARGADLGYPGMSFYFTGRGGVLGPVDADVVSAALVFFNPVTVRANWEPYTDTDLAAAAQAFIECGHAWADRLGDDVDVERLAELAGRVAADASPAAAPLFAAWRRVPEPEDPKALALHRMNVLRELRGNLHGAAVLAAGLSPLEAVMVSTPYMAGIFGWTDDLPERDPYRDAWDRAEAMTNTMMAPAFAGLSETERKELVTLADAAHASAT